MGCGDACPVLPGKHYLDWEVDDPAGQGCCRQVRPVRDEIEVLVKGLLGDLGSRSLPIRSEARRGGNLEYGHSAWHRHRRQRDQGGSGRPGVRLPDRRAGPHQDAPAFPPRGSGRSRPPGRRRLPPCDRRHRVHVSRHRSGGKDQLGRQRRPLLDGHGRGPPVLARVRRVRSRWSTTPMQPAWPRLGWGLRRAGSGVVIVLTLGTGIGSALIHNGRLVPNTELGHLELQGMVVEVGASNRAQGTRREPLVQGVDRTAQRLPGPPGADLLPRTLRNRRRDLQALRQVRARCSATRAEIVPAELRNDAGIVGAALWADRQHQLAQGD